MRWCGLILAVALTGCGGETNGVASATATIPRSYSDAMRDVATSMQVRSLLALQLKDLESSHRALGTLAAYGPTGTKSAPAPDEKVTQQATAAMETNTKLRSQIQVHLSSLDERIKILTTLADEAWKREHP